MRFHLLALLTAATAALSPAADPDGASLYRERCALCHEASTQTRAPSPASLKMMSAENVVRALETGLMKEQGASLTAAQKRLIATFLTAGSTPAPTPAPACPSNPPIALAGPQWNGWGISLENSRFQPAASAGLTADQIPRLKLKWSFAFPNAIIANGQPTVAGGRLFVASSNRNIYSLDARTGCQYWSFETDAPVRTAITIVSVSAGGKPRAFFGDRRGSVYSLDAATGELLWKVRAAEHPRAGITGAPVFHDGRVYVPVITGEEGAANDPKYQCCTGSGAVVALDASDGRKLWQANTIREDYKIVGTNAAGTPILGPSGASIWSAPTLDPEAKAIYVATGDNFTHPDSKTSDAILALDQRTGELLWTRQLLAGDVFSTACVTSTKQGCPENPGPDFDFGSSPILVKLPDGKRLLIAGQKSGVVHALDPDRKGAIVWQTRLGHGGILGGIQWGSASDGKLVFVALSDVGFSEFNLERGGKRILDPKAGGGLFALDAATGKKVWSAPPILTCGDRPNCSPAQSAAVSAIPGAVFSGALDGHLRAYSTKDGKVLWDFDTAHEFSAVNGPGKGGSIDGPGPVIVNGMVFANSGYGTFGAMPGNMLLAFSLDGK
jgi:polyvinyl alcohol dehydrogenase (cytochrome)